MPVFPIENQNPIITVCVVCYKQQDTITATINSILNQGVDNIQIIISDDASPDKTPEIAKELKDAHPKKIHLILHEKNKGITGNVQSIYPHIRGKYVCWFDGDDLYLPNKLQTQLAFMETNQDYIACYHDMWVVQHDTGVKYLYNDPSVGNKAQSGDIGQEMVIRRCFISGLTAMIRRDASTVKHRAEIPNSSDKLYMIEISLNGKMHYIDKPFVTYHRHENNISRTNITHENEEKCFDYLDKHYSDQYAGALKKGRALFYTMFFFKYLTKKRVHDSGLMLKKLMTLLKNKPSLIGFLIQKTLSSVAQRIALFAKTGRINR